MKRSLLALCLLVTMNAVAQDRYFSRTYTSNVLPKNSIDFELWHTSRFGHQGQFFHAQDQRIELEMGLGKNLQTALYFNRYQKRYSETDNGTTSSNEIGFSNEWKWKLTDQSRNKIGSAVYFEWGMKGGDELELEVKVILDKSIKKSLFAFNAVVEYEKEIEWKKGKVNAANHGTPVELNLAYLYNINYNWGLGFELRNHNAVSKGKGWENSVLFGGPTLNYRANQWFIIASYQPQWVNLHRTVYSPANKVLDENERVEARIILGISLK